MKRLALILSLLSISLSAYEKLNFIGSVIDNNVQNSVSVVADENNVYLLTENSLHIYDSSFSFISSFPLKTKKNISLTIGNDLIYILDNSVPIINVYNKKGEFVFSFGSSMGKVGALSSPRDIKYFSDGKIYVANTGLSRIEVFNKNGIYLYGFNTLRADGITKIKPLRIYLDRSGFLYLTDPDKNLIQKYDRVGRLVIEKEYRADSLAVNEYGIMYIADEKEGKIKELDAKMNVIKPFGTRGKGKFDFLSFADLTLNPQNHLFILDRKNKKMIVMELENSFYQQKLPESKKFQKIDIYPKETLKISPLSFGVNTEGSIIYYDKKERKGYLIENDTKKLVFSYGKMEGQVSDPSNIVYIADKIYVCDTGNDRVQIFDKEGKYLTHFGEKASLFEKNKEGKFNSPNSIAVDKKGNIYVADTGNNMLQAFNKDGIFLFSLGPIISNLKFMKLVDVKTDEDNNVYILDAALKKIVITDSNGKYLSSWDITGIEEPVSFDYDNFGFFYFLDRKDSRVMVYDKKGNYQLSFFTKGYGERELNEPDLLKIVNGVLYISDSLNNKVGAFRISYVPGVPSYFSTKIGDEKVNISWQIENPKVVKEYVVFRGKDKEEIKSIGKVKELSWVDIDLESDTTYYYQISAVSITGEENSGELYPVYFRGKAKTESISESSEIVKNKPPVEIIPVELNYVFSANYKYYLNNPLGKIYVRNNTSEKFNNLKVSFFLKDYMDFPSDFILPELLPASSSQVDLKATLNNKILTINEDTPVQAQLSISYYRDEKENTFNINQPIKILSRNAITWDNAQRMANFITIKDPIVDSFSKFMLTQKNEFEEEDRIDSNLLSAIIIWENLSSYGLSYVSDPVNPYSSIKSSSVLMTDTIQFPRNTLKLKSGDCDDLTVLLATFLESVGIRVMILDYPGHIALMAEMQASIKGEVGLPDDYIISYENKYFVPIETTMIGKSFYDAIIYAANMYKQNKDIVKIFELRSAMSKFEPVTLPDISDDLKKEFPGLKEKIVATIDYIVGEKFKYYEKLYKMTINENPDDIGAIINLGILYAGNKKFAEAQKIFEEILAKDNTNASAFNNLGNIYFLQADYSKAIDNYMQASKIDPFDDGIFLNLARTYVKLGKKEEAKIFIEKALKINPDAKNIAEGIIK